MTQKKEQIQKEEEANKNPETPTAPTIPENQQKELEKLDEDIERLTKNASKTIEENRQEEGQ